MQKPITALAFTDLEPLIVGAVSLEATDRALAMLHGFEDLPKSEAWIHANRKAVLLARPASPRTAPGLSTTRRITALHEAETEFSVLQSQRLNPRIVDSSL